MKLLTPRITIIMVSGLLYVSVLLTNLTESSRRTLRMEKHAKSADYVLVTIKIINVNHSAAEANARITLQPAGTFSKDAVTPAVNLKLLFNSITGTQEIDFPKGQRMASIEATFPLDGNVNAYPFDVHKASLWLLVTTPIRVISATAPQAENAKKNTKTEKKNMPQLGELAVSTAVLERNEPVPVSVDLLASIPGVKFSGNIAREQNDELTGIALTLTRPRNVVTLSIIVMTMMAVLAMSVLALALSSVGGREINLIPLTLSVSLIFGLPALRGIQPNVPPVGALGDYISFVWAEVIVAASAVIMAWAWFLRKRRSK